MSLYKQANKIWFGINNQIGSLADIDCETLDQFPLWLSISMQMHGHVLLVTTIACTDYAINIQVNLYIFNSIQFNTLFQTQHYFT